jgi:hypothetical protein
VGEFLPELLRDNAAIHGVGPYYDDVHLGSDGQLWRWDRGQVVVASSGPDAVQYARERGWPERMVEHIRLTELRRRY